MPHQGIHVGVGQAVVCLSCITGHGGNGGEGEEKFDVFVVCCKLVQVSCSRDFRCGDAANRFFVHFGEGAVIEGTGGVHDGAECSLSR